MFYIQTADRLQRTSVWRDNLEGGLDYLKAVVVARFFRTGCRVRTPYGAMWSALIKMNGALRLKIQKYVNALSPLLMPRLKNSNDPHIQFATRTWDKSAQKLTAERDVTPYSSG